MRSQFSAYQIDACLCRSPADVAYFTGEWIENSALLISRREMTLLIDFFRYEQIKRSILSFVNIRVFTQSIDEAICDNLNRLEIMSCGYDPFHTSAQFILFSNQNSLTKRLHPIHGMTSEFREIKSNHEIRLLEKSSVLAQSLLHDTIKSITLRHSEKQIAQILGRKAYSIPNTNLAFDPIVCSGLHTSWPHARPTDSMIKVGSLFLIDFGLKHFNYCSDLTVTHTFNHASAAKRHIYRVILNTLERMMERIHTRDRIGDLNDWMIDHITKGCKCEGYTTPLGHGIGLELHEEPFIQTGSTKNLKEGMVICLEPGVYIPGWGGVRLEVPFKVSRRELQPMIKMPSQLCMK